MDKKLRFFIIAGPNGAGKTSFGQAFVPRDVPIFNGDLVFEELIKRYPLVDPERLKGGVPLALEKARDKAIMEKRDFAFETNFSSDLTLELAEHLREEGYLINLIYFGLNDPDFAESRVKTRISLGGHDIPRETIRFNYSEGIKRIIDCLPLFDSISFISTILKPQVVASFDKSSMSYTVFDKTVAWFKEHFQPNVEKIVQQLPFKLTDKAKPEEQIRTRSRRKGRGI